MSHALIRLSLKALDKASSKTVRNNKAIISLLRETAPNRRRRIVEERPQVSTVLQKFAALQMYDMVSH